MQLNSVQSTWLTPGRDVAPEMELLLEGRVPFLGAPHVLVDLGDGDQHVVVETENYTCQEDHEAADGRVLKVCELELAWAELDAPADLRVGRRRLESHGLPGIA